VALTQLIVLAVLQGITEFLPISSSGHLALVPMLTGWPDQGVPMDVAVHVGTLFAVMIYFWRDLWAMLVGLVRFTQGKRDPGARLAFQIIVATIPVMGLAYAFETYVGDAVRSLKVIAWATLGYGILLFIADRMCMTVKRVEHATYLDVFLISIVQTLAFVPGTSRSGITMTVARFLGYERPEAARLSMLLSVPVIMAGGVWVGMELYKSGDVAMLHQVVLGAAMSFVVGLVVIAGMMAWLRRSTFTPFVIYRICLGIFLLTVAYGYLEL